MNQILDYNPSGKGGKRPSGSDSIVRVFAVIMILFAIALAGSGVFGLINSKKSQEASKVEKEVAKIEVTQEDLQAIIKVSHTKAIEKIIYSWNTGKETTIKATGESSVEQIISLPAGENILNIKVIDIDGAESLYEGTFISESGEDIINPTIELNVTDEKKLKITAKDETSLSFITYRWNDEQETEVKVNEENPKVIEVEIDILKGENDITVIAVDSKQNTTTETKSYTGLTKPEVTITVAADKKTATINVKHERGLTEVKLNLNNQEYNVDIGEQPTDISFDIELAEGENQIKVSALSIEETKTEVTENVSNITINPETEPTVIIEKSENGENAVMKAVHASGIKEVKFNVNDVDYYVDIGENPPEIQFEFPLVDGNNKITFTVIPTEGPEKQEIKEITK